jgi:hypothetical protein
VKVWPLVTETVPVNSKNVLPSVLGSSDAPVWTECKGITGMRRSRTRHLGDDADRLRGDWFRDLSPDEEEHDGLRSRLIVVGDDPGLVSDEPKHPPGPPMTLGNMRELGVQWLIASCLLCLSR